MRSSLFSPSWYRVAELRFRLRSHTQIHRHVYRDEVWYVLQDHSTGQFHRFTPTANLIIGLLDGRRTLQQIWEIASLRLGDDVPSQEDIINLIAKLHKADVLQGDVTPDIAEVEKRKLDAISNKLKQYFKNPLSLRFPLIDPDSMLDRLRPLMAPLFGWIGGILWLLVVGSGAVMAATHWPELTEDLLDKVFASENLVVMWLVYPLVKLIHEFGHAIAVKVRQAEVHEMGVMLLVMVPIPYVDATSASSFRDKKERMLVGSAGMLFEMFLAALAMFFWVDAQPGIARAFSYNIMLIAGVSTLVFNINPLLRFDGYYILSDLVEIPNLGSRSNQYLTYLVNKYLLRAKNTHNTEDSTGEKAWFVFYGIASFIYRMVVLFSIIFVVAGKFFFIGVVLAFWSVYTGLFSPVIKQIKYLATTPALVGRRTFAIGLVSAIAGSLVYLLFFVPFPAMTQSEGIVWAPEKSHVRAAQDCIIDKVLVQPNLPVKAGQPLFICSDPEQLAKVQSFEAQLQEVKAKQAAVQQSDQVRLQILDEEIRHVTARLDDARRRVSEMIIRSPGDGQFLVQQPQDWIGKFVRRGESLAYVLTFPLADVQVVVKQTEVNMVRTLTQNVQIRSVDNVSEVVPAVITRAVPAATDKLPSAALSQQGGGQISLDPTKPGDRKALESLFVFELRPTGPAPLKSLGSRVYVRFEHQPEPLGLQWYGLLRQMMLKKFNV
jgi:putative peptide zinc metalloprotease protein